jgi:hypothetical protein
MSDEPPAWPDDDEDPFAPVSKVAEEPDIKPIEEEIVESEIDEEQENHLEQSSHIEETPAPWSLPVRVAPVLAMSGEEVAEYPLNESPNGRKNTSLIVSDNLIRIIEATYDDDGQRRLNVKAVLKNELTGFSHSHNELMHKHQWMWITSLLVGLATLFIPFIGFLGQILLAVGIVGWTYMHLEVHTLEFSTSGSKHKVAFTGYGSNRPMFRASMALLGPTIAKYMDTGEFDTESITNLHESLAIPAQPVPPIIISENPSVEPQGPLTTAPPPPVMQPEPQGPPTTAPPPPVIQPLEPQGPPTTAPPPPVMQPPEPQGPPTTAPPPPVMQPPEPQGPPTTVPPPPISPTGPPLPPPLPPATLPPPLPPGSMMNPPPPMGFDRGEIPLDAPLPPAPEISVTAAPIEESLSADEKNELLEELQ